MVAELEEGLAPLALDLVVLVGGELWVDEAGAAARGRGVVLQDSGRGGRHDGGGCEEGRGGEARGYSAAVNTWVKQLELRTTFL